EFAAEARLLHHAGAGLEFDADVEQVEKAVGKLEMLTRPERIGDHTASPPQRLPDRTELYDFRPCAKRQEYAHDFSLHRFPLTKSSGISWSVFDQAIGRVAFADSPR